MQNRHENEPTQPPVKKPKAPRRMEPKLVSKQPHEIATVAKKFGVSQKVVRAVKQEVGRSREAIEAKLIEMGHNPKEKTNTDA